MHLCLNMVYVLGTILFILLFGCTFQETEKGFSVASYNVQTLFDDQLDGAEFTEFIPSSNGWNSKKYHNRLRQLSRTIRDLTPGAPDILVLQEIENSRVIEELDRYFIRDLNYHHVATAGEGALSIAVLSRWPFLDLQVHGVQLDDSNLRPLLEVHINTPESDKLILYAVHWKSKRGGSAQETEEFRRAAAHSLVTEMMKDSIKHQNALFIVAGDFNEDINEYVLQDSLYLTAIMPQSHIDTWKALNEKFTPLFITHAREGQMERYENSLPVLYHLWNKDEGSYFFNNTWEQIDNILFSPGFFSVYHDISFNVGDAWYLLDSSSRPRRYQQRSSSGYSDHLPIILEFFP